MKHTRENFGALNSYYEKVISDTSLIDTPFELPLTWSWSRLRSYCFPQIKQVPEHEFSYIDIDSIDNKRHCVKQPKVLQVGEAPSRARRKVFATSTVFSMVRPYLENIALVGEAYKSCIASTGFFVCTPVKNDVAQSLFFTLVSPFIVAKANASMKGDNSPSVRKEDMESLLIPVAPLPEQVRIVDTLDRLMPLLKAQYPEHGQ